MIERVKTEKNCGKGEPSQTNTLITPAITFGRRESYNHSPGLEPRPS